jgi:hypothetical protein
VVGELNRHWQPTFDRDYEKNDKDVYAKLADRTRTAVDNARTVREQDHGNQNDVVECNSSTEVYRLVTQLLAEPPVGDASG